MEAPAPIAHVAIHETVEKIFDGEPRGRVLDIPAGEGALALRLDSLGYQVACADLYPEIFKLERFEIRQANLDGRLPYDNGEFDALVCVEGLEHIENPANALREFSRVIKPGGLLVVSVPNIMNIEERFKWLISGHTSHFKPLSAEFLDGIRRDYPDTEEIVLHVNPIGYSEIRFLMEKNGFQLERTYRDKPKANSWAFRPFVSLIRLIAKTQSSPRRKQRWADELNSDEVLLGGNTLILKARKL
jgi:SAM-dependent methyltransferase